MADELNEPEPQVFDQSTEAAAVTAAVDRLDVSVQGLRAEYQRDIAAAEERHRADLGKQQERIDRSDKALHRTHVAGLAIVALIIAVIIALVQIHDTAERADQLAKDIIATRTIARQNTCLVFNDLRAAVRSGDSAQAEVLIRISERDPSSLTPEEAARRKAIVDAYRTGVAEASSKALAPQDCSPAALDEFYSKLQQPKS